jgi:hypothetical protein
MHQSQCDDTWTIKLAASGRGYQGRVVSVLRHPDAAGTAKIPYSTTAQKIAILYVV